MRIGTLIKDFIMENYVPEADDITRDDPVKGEAWYKVNCLSIESQMTTPTDGSPASVAPSSPSASADVIPGVSSDHQDLIDVVKADSCKG